MHHKLKLHLESYLQTLLGGNDCFFLVAPKDNLNLGYRIVLCIPVWITVLGVLGLAMQVLAPGHAPELLAQ